MDRYIVKLSPNAYKDIDGIFSYIAVEKLAVENAKAQTDRIFKALKTLETFPMSHQDRVEGRYSKNGYKQLIIDNYIAIFRIDIESKTVYVITVQYQGRNV